MNDEALELLIDRVLSGQGDAQSHAELDARLRGDPAALDLYCRCCALHSSLGRLGEGVLEPEILDALRAKASRTVKLRRWRNLITAAAALVLLSAGLWLWMKPAPAVVASLRRDAGTRVALTHGSGSGLGPHELASGSRLRILSGQATLQLPGGSSALLRQGSEIEVVSASHVRVLGGTAQWHISSGSTAIEIETPALWLTSREGDFEVEADPEDGPGHVAVKSGQVMLRKRSAVLPTSASVLGPASTYPPLDREPTRASNGPDNSTRWVRWSFDETTDGSWPSEGSGRIIPALLPVSANTPTPIEGTFGGALRFEPGQFLRAPWPAAIQEQSISFTGWIRFRSPADVPDQFASFFFMGNETATRPLLWWGIGIHPSAFKPRPGQSAPAPDPGRWTHFAGVIRGNAQTRKIERVLLYIGGREITNLSLSNDLPASTENNVVRLGNGSYGFDLDEWMVIERGLSPEEVARLAAREPWPLK